MNNGDTVLPSTWGEASPDVHTLLGALADVGMHCHSRSMRCSPEDGRSGLIWMLRRRWGFTAVRENARLLSERLEYVGRGATAAASRRRQSMNDAAAHARRAACRATKRR